MTNATDYLKLLAYLYDYLMNKKIYLHMHFLLIIYVLSDLRQCTVKVIEKYNKREVTLASLFTKLNEIDKITYSFRTSLTNE